MFNTEKLGGAWLVLLCVYERQKGYENNVNESTSSGSMTVRMAAKDVVPLDKPGFRHMVSKLNPPYQLLSRKHFSEQEIAQLYSHVRDSVVMPALKEAECFSATILVCGQVQLSPTVHFIDKTWNLQSFCLDTVPVFADHTGQNIADAVVDIFDNWQLSRDKLVVATTDSGSNIIAPFNECTGGAKRSAIVFMRCHLCL